MLNLLALLLFTGCILIFLRQHFIFSPTSIFIAYAGLAIPGSYLISNTLDISSVFYSSPHLIDQSIVLTAFLAMSLGIIGIWVGRVAEISIPRIREKTFSILKKRIYLALIIASGIGIVCAIDLINQLGGINRIISELGAVRSGELAGKGVQVYAITMLLPTVLQWNLVYCLRNERKYCLLALALCVISSAFGAGFGFRAPAIALLIQTIVIWYLLTKGPSRKALLIAVMLFIPVVTLAGALRFLANDTVVEALKTADIKVILTYLSDTTITRARGVETFSILKNFVDNNSYGLFANNLKESFLSIIPSALIEKPASLTEQIATQVYGGYLFDAGIIKDIYGGVSYTFISEGYWNAGFYGVFLYGFTFGLIFKIVERAEKNNKPTNLQILFYKAVAGFTPMLVEAPQLGVNAIIVNSFVNIIILMSLSLKIVGHKKTDYTPLRPNESKLM